MGNSPSRPDPHFRRVVRSERAPDGGRNRFASTPSPLGPTLKESFPRIAAYTRFYNLSALVGRVPLRTNRQRGYETGFCFADPSFFSLWTFPFVRGDPQSALLIPQSVVLTRKMAEKYFAKEDPLGKTLSIVGGDDYTVTGVLENIPQNSHLQFDFISPIGPLIAKHSWMQQWNIPHFFTYVLLGADARYREVNEMIRRHGRQFDPESFRAIGTQYQLQPVKDIHLRSQFQADLGGESTVQSGTVIFFSAVAAFILIIACINFINLATARAANRAKEIGIRKTCGATRIDIARQFFGESLICTGISLCLAILFVLIAIPSLNDLSGKQLAAAMLLTPGALIGLLGIAFITLLLAGLYPAWVLSSLSPVHSLKGFILRGMKKSDFRYLLVIVQFAIAIVLIIGTVVVYRQLTYIQDAELGYDKECLLYFPVPGGSTSSSAALKAALLGGTRVRGVTTASDLPTGTYHFTLVSGWEGSSAEDKILMNYFSVDEDYREIFGIKMAAGRFFSRRFPADAKEGFVLNETAVKRMGMRNPLGKRFSFYGRDGRIVGVVKDFHFKSFHQGIKPLILWMNPSSDRYFFVRIPTAQMGESIRFIESTYRRLNPEYPFEFFLLNDEIDGLYRSEAIMKKMLQVFSLFAIFISGIGLYGLASLVVLQRTRETGIRKILGASVAQLTIVLSRKFAFCVGIANGIAIPAAYVIMGLWLRKFAYRFEFSWDIFVLPGLLTLCLALLTVSFHTLKTARSNPVQCLRYE